MHESIAGTVTTVTHHNESNGFFIAKVVLDGELREMAVPVKGHSKAIYPGEHLQARGVWENSREWGPQFKATSVSLAPPTKTLGILKYLQSGAIKGIGKKLAERLVEKFGEQVFDVLENHPERLSEVEGVGKKRIAELCAKAAENKGEREIMTFLHANGLTTSIARKIHEKYGEHAIRMLRENPYRLSAEVFRVGFLTSDRFAQNLGVSPSSPYRLAAGLRHLLAEAAGNGSCGLPWVELVTRAQELLNVEITPIEDALEASVAAGQLAQDNVNGVECLFLPNLYRAEQAIARALLYRASLPPLCSLEEAQQRIAVAEAECKLNLGDEQRAAVVAAFRSNFSVITGGPGRGKTSCIKVLVTALEHLNLQVTLAAPTGKAAKRFNESTGRPAATLHLTLGAGPSGWTYHSSNPLPTDVIIVDEFSMVDVLMAATLLAALNSDTRVVLVGDKDQLPSVGPGRVFADLVSSGALPVGSLTKPYRQAEGSLIIAAADCINQGLGLPDVRGTDFQFVPENEPVNIADTIVKHVLSVKALGLDPKRDVQVLAPMRKSAVGTNALNEALRAILSPPNGPDFKVNEYKSFRVGDKVIQTKNNRTLRVMNGDIGYVVETSTDAITVQYDGIGLVPYGRGDAPQLELAYCITIHKSQGSEAPVVVMPVSASHFIMMQRNLLYTAMTRAKRRLVMVGQKWVAKKAAENAVLEDRHSMLLKLLRAAA